MAGSEYYICHSWGCSSDIYKDMLCKSCYEGKIKVPDSGMELSNTNWADDPIVIAQTSVETTKHFSAGKEGVDQIPISPIMWLGKVYTFGEGKYGRDNWMNGTNWSEFYGSTLRHIFKFWRGEWLDSESNLPHLAHAMWNIITLMYYYERKLGKDNRDIENSN